MYFYGNIQNIKYKKFMERVRIITSQNLGLISLRNKVASILILGTLTFFFLKVKINPHPRSFSFPTLQKTQHL